MANLSALLGLLKKVNVKAVLSTAEKAIVAASAVNSTIEYKNKDKVDAALSKASTAVNVTKVVTNVFNKD